MNFINIIGTLFDNSIEHVVALAQLIKDLRLNKNQLEINEDIYNKIDLIGDTYTKSQIDTNFQSKLVSGENIKTIQGQSLLGNEDIKLFIDLNDDNLPIASASTMNKMYFKNSLEVENIKELWFTVQNLSEYITYDEEDYPITNKGDFISFLENGGTPGEAGPGIVGVVLLTSYDSTTANIHNGYISPLGWVGIQRADNYYWDNFSLKLGDSYINVNDSKIYVCTPEGWVDKETLPITYEWKQIGSIDKTDLSNYYTKLQVDNLINNVYDIDSTNNWLKVHKDDKNYFIQMTELISPIAPTLSGNYLDIVVASSNNPSGTITITKPSGYPSGAQPQYSLNNGLTWTNINGTSFNIQSTFTTTGTNSNYTINIWLRSELNGEYTTNEDINKYTITIRPKCEILDIAITRSPNNNKYATSATITFKKSLTNGATTYYNHNGETPIEITQNTTINVTNSVAANEYSLWAIKTDYLTSNTKFTPATTLNAKKTYIAIGAATISDLATDTQVLGDMIEADTLPTRTQYTRTLPNAGYIWICCSNGSMTPSAIYHESTDVISAGFEAGVVKSGYTCYRSTEQWLAGEIKIYYKP